MNALILVSCYLVTNPWGCIVPGIVLYLYYALYSLPHVQDFAVSSSSSSVQSLWVINIYETDTRFCIIEQLLMDFPLSRTV